jgi:biotin carboxyl carrier protein
MKYTVTVNGKQFEVEVERAAGASGKTLSRSTPLSRAPAAPAAPVPAAPAPAAPAPAAPAGGNNVVVSPLPGTVLDIKVKPGDVVHSGQPVIVLEAMKMETEIVAPAAGTVDSILVKKGDAVDTEARLVILR